MRDGQKLIFYGKGDQQSGLEPGNVIIVLDEEEVNWQKRMKLEEM
jgi:hypothetical protein